MPLLARVTGALASMSLFLACTETLVVDGTNQPASTERPSVPPAPDSAPAPPSVPQDAEAPFDATPPPSATFPQAVDNGGSVIKAPRVIAITFDPDPLAPAIESFTSKLAGSAYWSTISAEYGVGQLTVKPPVRRAETPAPTLTQAQLLAWLAHAVTTDPRLGPPDGNTLYAIYYPSGVTISDADATSCKDYGGYHGGTTIGGVNVGYAVLPRCGGLDDVTTTASHEYLEWATDPFPSTAPAYAGIDKEHFIWGKLLGPGELGDLCGAFTDVSIRPEELGFVVQRTWSNERFRTGHDPCAPSAGPYFTAIPTLPDAITHDDGSGAIATRGVLLDVGETKTLDLVLYSDAPTPEWGLRVADLAALDNGTPELSFSLDRNHGRSGDTVHLTITGIAPSKKGLGFVVFSQLGQVTNAWPAMVVNR